jgi:hypothetical protein
LPYVFENRDATPFPGGKMCLNSQAHPDDAVKLFLTQDSFSKAL